MSWQPISTAPRDGTPVLIYMPDAVEPCISLAMWSHCPEDPLGDAWYEYWGDSNGPIDAEPSHWMPLPKPPSAEN